jgi:hypothetical protein
MNTCFRQSLITAMGAACDDMLRFTGKPAKPINAEYLFTVSVARQIDRLNSCNGEPYQIYLEKNRRDFARDCLLPVTWGHPLTRSSSVFRSRGSKFYGKERIDIAVYQDIPNNGYMGSQPVCAIELKGFNPSQNLVMKDLRRNLEYFQLTGSTGSSVLGLAFFGSLHCWAPIGSAVEERARCDSIQKKYNGWLSQLPKVPNVRTSITIHDVRSDLEGEVVEEAGCEVLNADTKHKYVGIIVEFNAA